MSFVKSTILPTLLSLFTIANAFAGDLYWVGNSGNWNDPSHWSSTSGGAGGVGVPNQNDNVTFDLNSFNSANQTVSVTANTSFNNLVIPSSVFKFELKSTHPITIDVYGIINVSAIFENELTGIINLKSANTNTKQINFGNWNWKADINFDGKGKYVLNSPLLTPENTITLTKGELDLNSGDMVCFSFISNSGLKRKLYSDGSDIITSNQWSTNTMKFSYNFSQTNIYVFNGAQNAVDKGGDNYFVTQSKPIKSGNNKTITSITIFDDTVSCGNACDGVLYIDNVVTDCPPYTVINWVGTGPPCNTLPWTDTVTCLCPGSYTAVLQDSCGFIFGQAANVLGHPPILPIFESTTAATCKGICDGSITVTVIGASYANMVFSWVPAANVSTFATTTTNDSLCAGPVSLNVVDGFGCDTTFLYNVPEPDSIYANVTVNDPLCFGYCSGTATSAPNGGTPPYSFVWTGGATGPGDTLATLNNLCAGTAYTVTITDVNGCTNDTTFTPTEPPQLQLDSVTQAVSCGGLCDGSITVTVLSGGVPPYTHNWSNGQVDVGPISTNSLLCAGNYCDTIRDANGCDTIYCFVIGQPDTLFTSTITRDLTCNGICDGFAQTTPIGGVPPYSYLWSCGGSTLDSITGLCPTPPPCVVTVTDTNGCQVTDTFTITEPLPIIVNPTATNVTCNGACDGTATASPTGGTGNPSGWGYSWTGPSCAPCLTQSISSLCPGTYILTVTDSVGCTAVDSVVISEPPPLVLIMSSTDETCGACDGTATVSVSGGYAPYTYVWVPPVIPNGQGTDSIWGLCPNNYTVTVTDSAGCTANNNVTVNPSVPILANLVTTNLNCNGVCNGTATVSPSGGLGPYTVSWDGGPLVGPGPGPFTINNLCAGPHTALITDANNCTLLVNFNITEPPALTLTTATTDASCFGVCDGSATPTPGGGTAPYVITVNPATPGPPYNAMCAGVYIFTVTDDSLCTASDTVTIFEPTEIFPNAQFTNITCNGLNNGTAISLPTGGTPGYTFLWAPVPACYLGPVNTNSISGLCPGTYVITVTDTNGCTGIDTVIITNPPALTVSANATAASCGTVCDGAALATPNGGTAPYTYSWTGPNCAPCLGNPITNLCAGTYTVTVTDSNGCTAQDTTVINPLINIPIATTAVGVSCNGTCDGTATASPFGGLAPYTYTWVVNNPPPNGQGTDSIWGLCPGWVYVTVCDANGCCNTDSILMPIAPPVLFPNGSIVSPVSCTGACDAVVTHSPSGGTPPYISVWTLPNGIDTNNVCSPFAVITITDSAGCVQSDTLIILDPLPITPNDVVTDVGCNGDSTGSITLTPTGGTGGVYTYVWVPNVSSTNSANNLPAGVYQITVTDSNGCQVVVLDTVNEPPGMSVTPIGVDVSCFGACDGMMAVVVSGGTVPYTYSWSGGQGNVDTIFNICSPPPGNLTNSVTVIDSNGCSVGPIVITITEPLQLLANVTGTPEGCVTTCDGTALASPTGGTGPYTYQWSANAAPNVLTNPGISNLCPGTYTVTITDLNGCIDTASYTVTTPIGLSVILDSTYVTCNGACDGTATATVNGGSTPFTYLWVGPGPPVPNNTPTITGLCPGVYTVTVTDSNNCVFIGSVIITEPAPLTDSTVVIGANCGANDGSICMFPLGGTPPYLHSWSTGATTNCIINLAAGFYTDTVTDFFGCVGIFTIAVSNPIGPTGVTATVNPATCYGSCDGSINAIPIGGTPPYSFAWTSVPPGPPYPNDSTLTGLCAGTYNLTVTDAAGCIYATSLIVGQADSISANSTFTDASCNGVCDGTASVTPIGGTPPYTFLWSTGATTSSVSGLCAGPVSVTITDDNGCTKVVNFNIGSPNGLTISSTTTNPTCNGDCDGSATANPLGGTGPYVYQWDDPSSQTTQTATGLCAGTYIVTVTDFNGCSGNDTVTIIDPTLIIANAVTTPSTCGNSDGTASVCASSGGTGSHTYFWPSLGSNSCSVTGLAAGTYTVEITDNNGCMQSFQITISDVNGPVISVAQTNASCNGVCDGTATVTVISGTPTYQYLWLPGGQTTTSVTGLCAGSYTVQVTDGNGCITTQNVIITDNTAISVAVSTVDATCNGVCDGSAIAVPNGGVPPYSFSWSNGQTINAVGGLCAGNYTVTVVDAIGCSVIQNVTINEPPILSVSVSGIAANCNGSCDGQATANPIGGTGPYTYLWSTNATTQTITALCAGTYTVTVTDVNGCTGTANINIGDGVAITAAITTVDATCGQCDGSITVVAGGGGGGPYTYSWSPSGQTTPGLSNLCPGAYILTITDNLGCSDVFTILINNVNGPNLSMFADSVTCFGSCDGLAWVVVNAGTPPYTFQWDDPALQTNDSTTTPTLCAGLYSVVVQDSFGCITVDTVTVPEPQEILANITFTNPSCNGVCDGTVTANPTGGVPPYVILWNNGTTNLCVGTHIVTITDAKGCSIIDSVTLTDPTPISITISSTPPSCNGDCDGTAIANGSGGTAPYTYSWNTVPVSNNSLVGGLCAGTYIVTVTDNNGCIDTASVQVIDPPVLSTVSTPTSPTCNNLCDGSITTAPAGGVPPYTYIWSNGDTTQTTSSTLCPGVYYVIIVDANNCTINDTTTLIAAPNLNDSTVVNGPTCGLCDGSATSTPVGGVGPFNFVWTDPLNPIPALLIDNGVLTSTVTGLCAGALDLQITDLGTGCIYNYTILVNSSNGPTINLTSTGESCPNACDGTATATPSGGTAPYTYSWVPTGPPTQTTPTATNLCSGLYTVTVTDNNGCITVDTISINVTNPLNLSITNIVPETCFGDCDGIAVVSVSGGTPTYNYAWTPTGGTTTTATGLCVGNYLVTVTDSVNCVDSISANITGPNLLMVNAAVNTPVSCNGSCDGAAIANVLGGTPNYTFAWNDPANQTTQIATNLCAGTYIVTVTDDNGCTAMDTITLTESSAIVDNSVLVFPACGICDGSITVAPTGGIGPYTFLWTTPTSPPILPQQVTASIINLCPGAYTLTITDSAGCVANFSYALSNINAPIPNTTVTNISCNGLCDGSISSAPTGGILPYSYFWSFTGDTTQNISGLCVGQYSLSVTDSAGCVGVAIDSVTQPAILQANINASNLLCGGVCDGWAISNTIGGTAPYTYNWTPGPLTTDSIINLCAGTYTVIVTDTNGCTVTDSVTLIEPTGITATSTTIDASCTAVCDGSATVTPAGGSPVYTYQWNGNTIPGQSPTQIGLCFGLNTVLITDANGCTVLDSIYIGAVDTVLADAGIDTTICLGVTVNLNGIATGTFTGVEWFELPSMNSLGISNSISVTPNAAGVFCYAFQTTGGCVYTDTVCITVDPTPNANAGPDVSIFEGGSTILNATGGFTYSWTPSTGLSDTTISNPVASPSVTTTYYVTVTSPNGCSAIDTVVVTVLPNIKFPDGISPNGDGANDVWIIDFIEQFPNNVVEIYNRWGELLFHADGYQQDWDGTYNGKNLPIGTYYYIIDLHEEGMKPFTGPLTILR